MGQLAKGTILSDIWGRSRWQGQADVKYLVDKFANLGKFHPAWPRDKSWGEEKGRGLFQLETGMPFLWRRECKQWDVGSGKSARFNLCDVVYNVHSKQHYYALPRQITQIKQRKFSVLHHVLLSDHTMQQRATTGLHFPMLCLCPTLFYRISGHPRIVL